MVLYPEYHYPKKGTSVNTPFMRRTFIRILLVLLLLMSALYGALQNQLWITYVVLFIGALVVLRMIILSIIETSDH